MLALNSNRTKGGQGLLFSLPLVFIFIMLLGSVGYGVTVSSLPAPLPVLTTKVRSGKVDTSTKGQVAWPSSQQAALGAVGNDVVAVSYSDEKSLPIASVAKVVTALAILKQKPLELDQPGPTIDFTSADVAIYNSYKAKGGSVVKVSAGEQLSQYQALQAMLIPSSNNMAVSMTNWAFGSEAAYVEFANKMVQEMGLQSTHIDDASGFSPKTVSSARDLVMLGKEALNNPVIARIVGQTEVTLPVAGKLQTTNKVMGEAGINGMKTGHTDESGGCFLFTAEREAGGDKITLIGAIVASPSIDEARGAAPSLVEQGYASLLAVTALDSKMLVGTMKVPWAPPVSVIAEKELKQVVWRGSDVALEMSITPRYEAGAIGTARLKGDSTELVLEKSLPKPDLWWRLTHPQELFAAMNAQ